MKRLSIIIVFLCWWAIAFSQETYLPASELPDLIKCLPAPPEKEVDMGAPFDWFGEESHPDYRGITEEQYANRMILRDAMLRHGFKPIDSEWWHFTLKNEPFPDTYFTFPVF